MAEEVVTTRSEARVTWISELPARRAGPGWPIITKNWAAANRRTCRR